ncbi:MULTISPECIES: hypothetical protein [Arsenophonus]|uniref:Uncharacterized protein n=3 Tax=Arsenophonus nasoniae TaxID=638 RepID=D2TYK0_9GAMM|nr:MULTISPECIES: hypothetical protein [Arsenophonus]MDR5615043.1 hypothetical protein [Arsenophonus sp.]QBY46908.1 hypothetical protein ArsFIN_55190 [Arsenophonus nasoniae]CBA72496.1 hypothetical protein ARN_12270 [Arsenophonus nasoniae]
MLDTLGKRLKCCRAATNTTAQEVVNHINETTTKESLSYASYTRWEADKVIPKRKNNLISYIADFFTNNGLYVSTEWLCNGEGFPPQFIEYKNLDEDTLFILAARNMKGCEIIQIGGTYGEPYVSFGEICIASKVNNINDNHGKLCFIEDINNNLYIGIMYVASEKNILLKRQDEIEIEKINIKECKKIRWIRKK